MIDYQISVEYIGDLRTKSIHQMSSSELITDAPIPAGSSLELLGGNKVVMEDNDALRVTATGATDVALSIMEIS